MNTNLDSDFIHGAADIGDFLNVSTRRAFYMLERRQIPATKIGNQWVARRSKLLEHFEAGEAEAGRSGEAA